MTDYAVGDTLYHKFSTRAFASGAPTTLAGTPVVSIYEDDSVTEITAGITLTADFDSKTGLNHLTVVATGGNGYETGKFYQAVITTGTVGGVSVVGETIWTFSLDASGAVADIAALNDVAATDIVSAGAITTLTGAVVNVDLVDLTTLTTTTTTNTDQRGTDNAALATALATAQTDLDTITGADGATLATTQVSITWGAVTINDTGAGANVTLGGSGSGDGLVFTRSGAGDLFGTNWAAAIQSEVNDALVVYDGPTNAEMEARTIASAAYFDPAADTVANVSLVATTTTNTDMRGTNSANTVAPDNTGIAAIQTQTDKLTFTVANQLDGNIQYVNDVQVTGDGGSGTEWGPV